jgi:glutamate synthase (NADPH) large chain
VAVFHQRFSTNTLPQWRLAHPYRYLAHNGEINTVQGNRSWAVARGPLLRSPLLPDLSDILPLVSLTGSDSQSLDNMLELLLMGGLDPMHAMRMLVPPAWQSVDMIDPDLRRSTSTTRRTWSPGTGRPASCSPTAATPAARWIAMACARRAGSSPRTGTSRSPPRAGVWDYLPERGAQGQARARRDAGARSADRRRCWTPSDVDDLLKSRHPYKAWLKKGVRYLQTDLIDPRLAAEPIDRDTLALYQKMFNVSAEERDEIIRVLAEDESEAVGSMGDDTPMPVLSHKVRSLYDYFRQQFAQVTNPPIDRCARSIVMSLQTQIGPECNIFVPAPQHAEQIVLSSPILSQRKLRQIVALEDSGRAERIHRPAVRRREGLKAISRSAIRRSAVRAGKLVLLLSDRYLVKGKLPIHALLATGAVHHRLVATGLRCKCNILVETGTARDAHHFACLIGYGATAVYPVHGLPDAVRPDAQGRGEAWKEARGGTRPQLPARHPQGPVQDHVQDGHLDHRELPQRAAVRDRRAGERGRALCFEGTDSRIQGADFDDLKATSYLAMRAWDPASRRAGRAAQVHARRRVPHVQPGRDRDAAGGGDERRLRAIPAVRALVNERPVSTCATC